jgi:carboxymethylenebutenolidase
MTLSNSSWMNITTADGIFKSYIVSPENKSKSAPAIVVIQEIFGINEDMKTTCHELAAQGYIALCPDLFWRQEADVNLTDKTQAEWDKAFALYNGFDVDAGIRDIAATIAAIRALPTASGKVGSVGYCLGGLLAYLTAARTDVNAAVSYYGVGIEKYLSEASDIQRDLLMHMGEEDEFVSAEAREQIISALTRNNHIDIYTYPRCMHAFARNKGINFNADAAVLANQRTAAFFSEHLK